MHNQESSDWWRGAVIYQIYPRSFQDSNNDGVGDLRGIIARLDHIAALGVDGIWISPFFKSPMKDFGYDVSDYRDIDPLFGTLADFDALLARAHSLNLKVIIDLVLSHTSDQHPWFNDPAKKDWYVWADAKIAEDGTRNPPNNWVSVFGGDAWEWDERYGQYYLHNFLKEQPDLNFHNPSVQDEILDICRFWLDRGVDGFRLDVVNFYFHDEALRDNPPRERSATAFATQLEADVPYSRQQHIYDKSRPENLTFIAKMRALLDTYPDKMSVGEIGDDYPDQCAVAYTNGNTRLHTSYNTALMSGTHKKLDASLIRGAVEQFENQAKSDILPEQPPAWPSWAFSNHDVVRAASRWYAPFSHDPAFSKMLMVLLLSLRGTIFMYQGEEFGLPEAQIPFEKLQDPWARETWPHWQGRDGCRSPMPWHSDHPNAGFSESEPWLPIPQSHLALSHNKQMADNQSLLHFTRAFLSWRKSKPELLKGEIEFMETSHCDLLHFTRYDKQNKTQCIFNLGGENLSHNDRIIARYNFIIDGMSSHDFLTAK